MGKLLAKTDELKIFCDKEPKPDFRMITPYSSEEERKDIEEFPFILEEAVIMDIWYKGKWYLLHFPDCYKWNGASIPKWAQPLIGSFADPRFLLASMPHDLVCNNRQLIDNNRLLSSKIFYEILKACGVNKALAYLMFVVVDNFQKTQNW